MLRPSPKHHKQVPRKEVDGLIYFVEGANKVKIGFCKLNNLKKRLQNLQIGSPVRLVLLGSTTGNMNEEQLLHQEFRQLWSHGEWFNLEAPLTEYIARVTGNCLINNKPQDVVLALRSKHYPYK